VAGLEALEARSLLAGGQWIAVLGAMSPAGDLGRQAELGGDLLRDAGVPASAAKVVSALDLSGSFLLQGPADSTILSMSATLDDVPGFVYVTPYATSARGYESSFTGRTMAPQRERSERQFGPFNYQNFLQRERLGQVADQSGPVLSAGPDVLGNNNAGTDGSAFFTQSETALLAFGDTVILGYNDAGSNGTASNKFTGLSRSVDGGATFADGGTLPTNPNGDAGDPVFARHEATGRIYFSTLQFSGAGINMFRSDDGGATWSGPVQAAPGKTGFQDKQWHAVDNFAGPGNGNVYLAVRDFGSGDGISFFRSTDGGASFGPDGGTLIASGGGGNVQGAYVTVGADHSVNVFYFDEMGPVERIMLRRSTDYGVTFGAPIVVASLGTSSGSNGDLGLTGQRSGTTTLDAIRSNAFPAAAVNPATGELYVTFADNPAGSDRADVFLATSGDGGQTWSTPMRVNDDATTNDQWQPTLAVTPDGSRLGVFYYSRELDTTTADGDAANNRFRYFGRIAGTSGAGVQFGPSFAVSNVDSLPEFGRDPAVNPTYMGDYDMAAATDGAFHVIWSDNRSPLPGGSGRMDPNVYYERIELGLGVAGTTPAPGSVVAAPPVAFTVELTDAIDPATVDASDLRVNGVPASGVAIDAGLLVPGRPSRTLTFTFATSPVTAQGLQFMSIAPGAIARSSDGSPLLGFEATFRYDVAPLSVVASTPAAGGVLALPAPLTVDLTFSEPLAPGSLQPSDLNLAGSAGAYVAGASLLPGGTTARFTIGGVTTEGSLTVSLGGGQVTDVYGNPGAPFLATYVVDNGTRAYPAALGERGPAGSLAREGAVTGNVDFAGDMDRFTLDLEANQRISVILTPRSPGLRARVEIAGPADQLIGLAVSPVAGQAAAVQSRIVSSGGLYTISVSAADGSVGGYTLRVVLNGSFEREGNVSSAANNTRGGAQKLDTPPLVLNPAGGGVPAATREVILGGDDSGLVDFANYDFETGQQGWTIQNNLVGTGASAGLWGLTTRRGGDLNHSAVTSFWYGNPATGTYDTGVRNAGAIVSPEFVVPADALLSFRYLLVTEAGGSFDQARVQISNNGGTSWTDVRPQLSQVGSFYTVTESLAAYAGQSVKIRFFFDTIDFFLNSLEGWYVDDVRIVRPGTWTDYYAVSAGAGETIDLAVDGAARAGLTLAVENSAGVALATGTATAAGGVALATPALPASGTYYVRVAGAAATSYALVVNRNARFDQESNNSFAAAQPMGTRQGALGAITGPLGGSPTVLNAADSGWISSDGAHQASNNNYLVGANSLYSPGTEFRNYATFALSAGLPTITGAELRIWNPANGFVSMDRSETLSIFDVSGSPAALDTTRALGDPLGRALFQDLGTGTVLGSRSVSIADNGAALSVPLNAAAVAALNASIGSTFALGGAITTLSGLAEQSLFSFTSGQEGHVQLVLQTATTVVNAADTGWIAGDGSHASANANYLAGRTALGTTPGVEFRNYATFALAATLPAITGAELRIWNPGGGYASPDPSETYTLFDVAAAPAALDVSRNAGDATGLALHADLGSGTAYGSRAATAADNATTLSIPLNAAAVAALNASIGSTFALGGAITSLGGAADQTLFNAASGAVGSVQLVLQTAAESDWYTVDVSSTAGALHLETRTPGDAPGDFVNNLNPKIELYSPAGTLVASGVPLADGRNEAIGYAPTVAGPYRVRLIGEGGSRGEYYLGRGWTAVSPPTDSTSAGPRAASQPALSPAASARNTPRDAVAQALDDWDAHDMDDLAAERNARSAVAPPWSASVALRTAADPSAPAPLPGTRRRRPVA
jgi:hypothetical protein